MVNLTVYKASAGSGKTFRLAIEYIKLLIDNPNAYRNILAVTFTNKATEEMKQRILWQLYGIGEQLPASEDYTKKVCEELNISRDQASRKAKEALSLLIHNYSYFRVGTIDSFFQSVLRNLARELDLTANLRIELNDTQIMEQAVDEMIAELDAKDRVLQWIIEYIEQNIRDDKSWNVFGQIKKFGKTIFEDTYKKESKELNEKLATKGFFNQYSKKLRDIRDEAKSRMAEYADKFDEALDRAGLSATDLKNGTRGISSYFNKLRSNDFSDKKCINSTLSKHLAEVEEWATKTSPNRDIIISLVEDRLFQLLHNAEAERQRQWRLYVSADVTLKHLNQLRLLNFIENKVRRMNEEANRFLLSDTQKLLHDLIDDSDSPFIFEKIGSQLEHIMIDEFQDTSTVQWQNFRILLLETLSHRNSRNLIVGDVKQSIYRWRNGDWRLLNNIEQEFNPEILQVKPLKTNFRSSHNVIDFNNRFFEQATEIELLKEKEINAEEADQLGAAYSDVRQEEPKGKGNSGYVRVELLEGEDYDNMMLEKTVDAVDQLTEAGVKPNQIAILLRSNRHIPEIAEYFMRQRPQLKLVSDEAFRLDASLAVNIMVGVMMVVYRENDMLTRAFLKKSWDIDEIDTIKYKSLPIKEMAESIYRDFHIDRLQQQSAYVCAFFDQITKFIDDFGSNLHLFLKEWNERICKKTIQSDEADGIRLLSIHKSKGLEFHSVIIPYCDWKLEMGGTIWCRPKEEDFKDLPIVPIDYSAKLKDSIYAEEYKHEHLQNCVDNLNLLYVAFTRAKNNLIVFGKQNGAGTRSELVEQVIGGTEYELGQIVGNDGKEREANADTISIDVVSNSVPAEFRQSNKSRDFIEGDSEDEQQNYIKMGSVLHNLFSNIRTTDDIPAAIRQMEYEGVLYNDEVTAEKLKTFLEKRLSSPHVKEWFSPKWQLFNECTILTTDAEGNMLERRPDRVMTDGRQTIVVDFKFGTPKDEYIIQVREYMELLREMGMPQVSGYLWFVYSNKTEEVRL
ncbi:MAG: UvrD-helicase domain-containing protein [Prevotella sp.]|nr:UvrD-helicase domain-containing protein [Prevotella sp.]